jgi:hypothetical protein
MPAFVSLRLGRGLTPQADALPWRALARVLLQGWRLRRGLRVLQRLDVAPRSCALRHLRDTPPGAHQRLLLDDARLPPGVLLVASSDGARSLVWRVRPNAPLACLEASAP